MSTIRSQISPREELGIGSPGCTGSLRSILGFSHPRVALSGNHQGKSDFRVSIHCVPKLHFECSGGAFNMWDNRIRKKLTVCSGIFGIFGDPDLAKIEVGSWGA